MRRYRRIVIATDTHHPADAALERLLRDGLWLRCETPTAPDAAALAARAERDASIWVRDETLLHVARALRRTGFRGRIGVYVGDVSDALETSPLAAELIDALLAFDRIGFCHATASARFLVAARRFGAAIAADGAIASRYRITETEVAEHAIDVARRCLHELDLGVGVIPPAMMGPRRAS